MPAEQEAATISSVLIGLLPVLLGGLLTILGGFAGSLITYMLSRKSSKEDFRVKMIEKATLLSFQIGHWLDENKDIRLFRLKKDIGPSPVSELEMVTKLYLPELDSERLNIAKAENDYNKWIIKGQSEYLETNSLSDEFLKEFDAIYTQLSDAVTAFVEKASTLINAKKDS